MGSVVVTRVFDREAVARLAESHDAWIWGEDRPIPGEVLLERTARADGLLCLLTDRIDRALLDAAPRLRAVSQMAVGVDNIDLEACTERRIPVGHTPDVLTETTADTALALMLAALRRLPEGIDHVRSGAWGEWTPHLLLGRDLHGSTVGIIGLGRIGRAVARRCAGFGCRLVYSGPRRRPEAEAELRVAYRSLPELLGEAGVVVLCLPLTPRTRHLIDAEALRLMRPEAVLVNISRGGLVDQDALASALAEGRIAAAALDVTEPEPIPAEHPLVGMPNCLILPHLGSASIATRRAMAELAVTNLLEAMAGRPMPACANPQVYV